MTLSRPRFFFDFVDPLSYLVSRELTTDGGASEAVGSLVWTPFELRPPPTPLVGQNDGSLVDRWAEALDSAEVMGIELRPPELVPWSRKAHELTLYAETHERDDEVRARTFEAYFVQGADIGRVDVLVEIGRSAGLDLTETKAVLDVDRFEGAILEARALGASLEISDVPALLSGDGLLRGFHNRTAIGTFLRA
jgi:predicted DsbA family dithiol-disulfide isomerase